MRKRLRKKQHVREFRELGFAVEATLHQEVSAADHAAFIDAWIGLVESRGMAFGGGGLPPVFAGFVTRAAGGSTTEADRAALAAFLAGQRVVAAHHVGELVDAWR